MKATKYILFLTILILSGCKLLQELMAPDLYKLGTRSEYLLNGQILSPIGTVKPLNDNEIILEPGGITSLKSEELTQIHADFTVKIMEGDGLRFVFRTTTNKLQTVPGISFDYTTSGCIVKDNENIVTRVDSITAKPNELTKIQIWNDGTQYIITADCDTVFNGHTTLDATEYIIISSINSCRADLSGILFDKVFISEELLLHRMRAER